MVVVKVEAWCLPKQPERFPMRQLIVSVGVKFPQQRLDHWCVFVAHGGKQVVLGVVAEVQMQNVNPPRDIDAQRAQNGVNFVHLRVEQMIGGDVTHGDEVAD